MQSNFEAFCEGVGAVVIGVVIASAAIYICVTTAQGISHVVESNRSPTPTVTCRDGHVYLKSERACVQGYKP